MPYSWQLNKFNRRKLVLVNLTLNIISHAHRYFGFLARFNSVIVTSCLTNREASSISFSTMNLMNQNNRSSFPLYCGEDGQLCNKYDGIFKPLLGYATDEEERT
jgi:hypothetical protein